MRNALAQLFLGYTLSETKTYTFYVDPTGDMDKEVLFRFSRRLGVVDTDDLAGYPVFISIKDQHTVPAPVEGLDVRKKAIRLDGIQYNVPSKAKVEIFSEQQPLVNAEVAFVKQAEQEGRCLVIRPQEKLPIGHFSHDPKEMQVVYDIGIETGKKYLEELKHYFKPEAE